MERGLETQGMRKVKQGLRLETPKHQRRPTALPLCPLSDRSSAPNHSSYSINLLFIFVLLAISILFFITMR